jgi:hypothetical protein
VRQRWDPWAELRKRSHLIYARVALPSWTGGGLYWPVDGRIGIFIDPRASRVRRRCLLAHELVHDERFGGCYSEEMPATWDAVVARDEQCVDNIVADRLVPPDELRRFCRRMASTGVGITPADVAAEFDVTDKVARRALRRLRGRPP